MSPLADDRTQEPDRDPEDTPARAWRAALKRVNPRAKLLNIPLLASGVAFWALLSLFPMLIALITVYGLVSSPQDVTRQVDNALGALSKDAQNVIGTQLKTIASGGGSLSVGLIVSVLVSLWSASGGVQNLMKALSTAYEQEETRGAVALKVRALLLTVGALVMAVIVIGVVGVLPRLLRSALENGALRILLYVLAFVVLYVLVVGAITVLYRLGPANRPVGLHWASAGALFATTLWAVGTIAFAIYVNNFSKYGNVYGALAGVIVLMLWLYLTVYAILMGALLNAETEREVQGDAASYPEGADRPVVRNPQRDGDAAPAR